MRSVRQQVRIVGIALVATIALAACVPSADSGSSATLAPLGLPPVTAATSTTLVAPTTAETATTTAVVVDPSVTSVPGAPLATVASESPVPGTTVATAVTSTTIAGRPPEAYTVVDQDTVSGIARKCSTTPKALAEYNGWADGPAHPIYPGDVVKLPCGDKTATSTTTTTTTTTIAAGPGGTYTIVADDYLAGIAAKTGTTVDGIIAVNGWTDGVKHLIVPGQKIKLPAKSK
jgi:LysM repeat protein